MLIHVINLDRTPDRLAEFNSVNGHLEEICRFPAVDGNALDESALIRDGIIEKGAAPFYTRGALGNALSHISLWDKAIETGQILTVCEDDAIFNRDFVPCAETIIDAAPPDWDIILWGWNFDSVLAFEMIPSVVPCVATFDQDRMRAGASNFQNQTILPQVYRLYRAYGTPCYSISPRGAKILKPWCMPIREMTVFFPVINANMPNGAVDVMMSNAYPDIHAVVSFPPLVITKNERSKSTNK